MFQPGEVLDGRYTILEEIGRGGMATVYKAAQPAVNRLVAVKVLPAQFAADASFYERFENEARLIAGLEHPRILPVYDFGRHRGQTYLVMRYVEGGTLFDELRRAPLHPERLLTLLAQIADALDRAHQAGVVHRDIKPSNILMDRNGNAYVGDFGIAKALEQTTGLTGSAIIGTPEYMAPEQAQGHPVDARTDVYALGIVVFQMATGRLPFSTPRGDALSLAYKQMTEAPPAPRSINPHLLPGWDGVILKALAKDPAQRYASAGQFARAMKDVYDAAVVAGAVERAAADFRQQVVPEPEPTVVDKLLTAALAGGLGLAGMFVVGMLITLAGAFTQPTASGGALVTIEDVGLPLVAAAIVGLAGAMLRLLRVLLRRSGCLDVGLHGALGLGIGTLSAFIGVLLYLFVTPTDTTGGGVTGLLGALLTVFNLFGFSVMGAGLGAGLAGPLGRKQPLWQNGLALVVPVVLGLVGSAFATFSAYNGSANVYDFVRLVAFFWAEPVLLVVGLAVAEVFWKFSA